jgi:hypothetical protein
MTATRPLSSSEAAYCRQLVFIIAYICCFTSSSSSFYIEAFQSYSQQAAAETTRSSRSSSNLLATGNGSSSGGMGFGSNNSNSGNDKKKSKKPKYTIEDKSYGTTPSSSSASAEEFFTTYNEWLPLFREYSNSLSAHSILTTTVTNNDNSNDNNNGSDTLWGISTIEGRTPWKLLPSKPEHPTPLSHIGTFLDEWQRSLLDIPIDTLTKEEDIGKGNNDLHFLEEGRRTIAVTRFHVVDGDEYAERSTAAASTAEEEVVLDQWENEVFRTCWSEIGHLMSQDIDDTGSLVVLPNIPLPSSSSSSFNQEIEEEENSSLEYIQQFVEKKLVQPISWMGRSDDWEIVAMNRGNLAVRLLYKLSAIPDLSEKYSPEED